MYPDVLFASLAGSPVATLAHHTSGTLARITESAPPAGSEALLLFAAVAAAGLSVLLLSRIAARGPATRTEQPES